jgi:tetratricopeptide (TPR) repeat protein
LEAKHYIAQAMRHRKKLPTVFQYELMMTNYQIHGEWDKAEKLIDFQLEMAPNDASILYEAISFYVSTGQFDKSRELLQHYVALFPSSGLKPDLLWLNLITGELAKVEKEAKALLQQMPQNLTVQLLLATTNIHQQEYAAAREVVEQILIIDPDKEKILSPLLEAIAYMQANPDYLNNLNRYEGFYRYQGSESLTEFYISQRGIWGRTMNGGGGVFLYPSVQNHLAGVGLGQCYLSEYLENDAGEIYALILRHCTNTGAYYHWKQDSLFWQAEELLRARDYERAATAYAKLLAEHPEHYYLYDAQAHLDYMASKTEAEIQELYQRYVGDYDGISIRIENGELLYKRPGVPRRILRPISDTQFMTLSRYISRYAFDVEQGKVKGLYGYRYDNEAREWRRNEEQYFARTQLAD